MSLCKSIPTPQPAAGDTSSSAASQRCGLPTRRERIRGEPRCLTTQCPDPGMQPSVAGIGGSWCLELCVAHFLLSASSDLSRDEPSQVGCRPIPVLAAWIVVDSRIEMHREGDVSNKLCEFAWYPLKDLAGLRLRRMCTTGTALKLQIEELQAKNEELQTKNLELQTLKTTTLCTKDSDFLLSTVKNPAPLSLLDVGSAREALPARSVQHQFSWNGMKIASESSPASVLSVAGSTHHSRRQSLHDRIMGRPLPESAGHLSVPSSLRQLEPSDRARPPALSLAGSSSDGSTSPLDPGSYLDAASETLRSMDIARPHSPSQSPLSTYFKNNIPINVPMAESWTPTRTQPDSSSTRECLPWPDSYVVSKPTAQNQHAKQKALRIAVVNRQISSVELLIKYGVDLNLIGDNGRTVLHDAAESNDGEMVQMLLGHGADSDLMDRAGMTALEVASSLGNIEVAEVLLKSSLG